MDLETGWTIQIGGGQISNHQVSVSNLHYSLIRKDTNLGPPDLDSPQKYASGDI